VFSGLGAMAGPEAPGLVEPVEVEEVLELLFPLDCELEPSWLAGVLKPSGLADIF